MAVEIQDLAVIVPVGTDLIPVVDVSESNEVKNLTLAALNTYLEGTLDLSLQITDINNLQTELANRSLTTHTHVIADVAGLQNELDLKFDATTAGISGRTVIIGGNSIVVPTELGGVMDDRIPSMVTSGNYPRFSATTGQLEERTVNQVRQDIMINNVDNTADTDKPVSTATQTALDLKLNLADAFSGAYSDLTGAPTTITQTQSDAITANTTKLAGIEAMADVTDTENVNTALGINTATGATDMVLSQRGTFVSAGGNLPSAPAAAANTVLYELEVSAAGVAQWAIAQGGTGTPITVDTVITDGSTNPVTNNAIFDALALKQDTLTIDTTPTDGSTNVIDSNAVFDALALKQDTLAVYSETVNADTTITVSFTAAVGATTLFHSQSVNARRGSTFSWGGTTYTVTDSTEFGITFTPSLAVAITNIPQNLTLDVPDDGNIAGDLTVSGIVNAGDRVSVTDGTNTTHVSADGISVNGNTLTAYGGLSESGSTELNPNRASGSASFNGDFDPYDSASNIATSWASVTSVQASSANNAAGQSFLSALAVGDEFLMVFDNNRWALFTAGTATTPVGTFTGVNVTVVDSNGVPGGPNDRYTLYRDSNNIFVRAALPNLQLDLAYRDLRTSGNGIDVSRAYAADAIAPRLSNFSFPNANDVGLWDSAGRVFLTTWLNTINISWNTTFTTNNNFFTSITAGDNVLIRIDDSNLAVYRADTTPTTSLSATYTLVSSLGAPAAVGTDITIYRDSNSVNVADAISIYTATLDGKLRTFATTTADTDNTVATKGYVDSSSGGFTVDSALSSISTNPLENRAINTALGLKRNIADVLPVDAYVNPGTTFPTNNQTIVFTQSGPSIVPTFGLPDISALVAQGGNDATVSVSGTGSVTIASDTTVSVTTDNDGTPATNTFQTNGAIQSPLSVAQITNDQYLATKGYVDSVGSGASTTAANTWTMLQTFSSGVALGGTGAANTLDDYEEGTWTPTARFLTTTDSTNDFSSATARYTKIGRIVKITGEVEVGANNDFSSVNITSLPFTASEVSSGHGILYNSNASSSNRNNVAILFNSTISFTVSETISELAYETIPGNDIFFSATYETDE